MPKPNDWFGAHMSIAGGHERALEAGRAVDCSVIQIFTKSSNQWKAKPLTPSNLEAFRQAREQTQIRQVIGHTSYLINLASPNDSLWEKSIAALIEELQRAEALGLSSLVHHPGSHVGSGEEVGLSRIVLALNRVLLATEGFNCRLALESTAGQGDSLGCRADHLGRILKCVELPERLAVCLDSCHLYASGYPLDPESSYNQTMNELDRAFGLEQVVAWHLNDSLKPLGSRVDRHAGIGEGQIGLEPFRRIVNDSRFEDLPMILETPKGLNEEGVDCDVVNLRRLRELVEGKEPAPRSSP